MLLEPKYLPKLAATVGLFTRYGLADFAKQQGLKGIAPEPDSSDGDGAPSAEKAAAFRKRLVELGPAYVKLGQVLTLVLPGRGSIAVRPREFGLEAGVCRDLILRYRDDPAARERLPEFDSALDLRGRPVQAGELRRSLR